MTDIRKLIEAIKCAKTDSTDVTAWHHNGATVRGPFNRWLEVTEVAEEHTKYVAWGSDDAKFASVAMNSVMILIKKIEELEQVNQELEAKLYIDDMLRSK